MKTAELDEMKKDEIVEKPKVDWMPEALQIATSCWGDTETKDCIMDKDLVTAVATRIVLWIETAAQNQRNADYYRVLLVRCGEIIGKAAYIADDGSRCEDVLCAKIPELTSFAFGGGWNENQYK